MGEAKRHRRLLEEGRKYFIRMSRGRFNIYAIGTRRSPVYHMFEEISWWSSPCERLISVVGRDKIDNDYSWMILARDELGRFRAAKFNCSYPSLSRAEQMMWSTMADIIENGDIAELGRQGDATNAPLDLLRLPPASDRSKLHPYFRILLESPARAPARAVVREIGPWLAPKDPHLVEEFQRKAFDQRLWEIYLWAALREFGLDVEQLEAPDFRCSAPGIDFTVEATTAAPSTMGPLAAHPKPKTLDDTVAFLKDYMPIKYGSALVSKLNKTNRDGLHYWEREESREKPFLIAIADFHRTADKDEPGSMTYTQAALWQYLYGIRVSFCYENENIALKSERIVSHQHGDKVIPSGFFDQPLTENISAVLFSNAGTLAKFDRMGIVAGFRPPDIRYFRVGMKFGPAPGAFVGKAFSTEITSETYQEYWSDEIQIFHNPNARFPLSFDALPGALHHYLRDGELKSFGPDDTVLSSYTLIVQPYGAEAATTE